MGKASRKNLFQRQIKPSSKIKISQALSEICEHFLPTDNLAREDNIEKLLGMAVLAWNIANSSEEKQRELLDQFIDSVPNMRTELKADAAKFEQSGDIPSRR